jgi:hypothetical protein
MIGTRRAGVALLCGVLLWAGGCTLPASPRVGVPTDAAPTTPTTATSATASTNADTISYSGTHNVHFGQTLAELQARHLLPASPGPGCALHFLTFASADPVFDRGRLVLIWAYPPLHTPEGVAVGSALNAARVAYPNALALAAPTGSGRFDGLLVPDGHGEAYLLLHDGRQVQKLVVGFEPYARQLFATNYGAC